MARPLDPDECRALMPRILARCELQPNGCLLWTGSTNGGYPHIGITGVTHYVHRVALVARLGRDILPGLQVGHTCHDAAYAAGLCPGGICEHRRCIAHLAEQTPRGNTLSGGALTAAHARKTHCPRGHALGPVVPSGVRYCATCRRERNDLIRDAARQLGLTRSAYVAAYGWSRAVALDILNRGAA